uniref:Akirin n=1 Tax=Cuerna arida TaxID=1464854 RepID=A0A1B6FFW5_9HEMI
MACATLKRHLDFDTSFVPNKRPRCSSVNNLLLTNSNSPSSSSTCTAATNQMTTPPCTSTGSGLRSMSMSPSPPPPHRPDLYKSRVNQEKLASKIIDVLRKTRQLEKIQSTNTNFESTDNNEVSVDNSCLQFNPNQPIFTFFQVNLICRKILMDFEKDLRQEYEKILDEKLAEQYDTFAKFSQDQLQKRFNTMTPSYLS